MKQNKISDKLFWLNDISLKTGFAFIGLFIIVSIFEEITGNVFWIHPLEIKDYMIAIALLCIFLSVIFSVFGFIVAALKK